MFIKSTQPVIKTPISSDFHNCSDLILVLCRITSR